MSRDKSITHSVPKESHNWHGGGPPVHLVLRFLHASQAADILPLICFLREIDGFTGGLPLADLSGRDFGGEGMIEERNVSFRTSGQKHRCINRYLHHDEAKAHQLRQDKVRGQMARHPHQQTIVRKSERNIYLLGRYNGKIFKGRRNHRTGQTPPTHGP